ncbi:MAG TPA: glycerol acyltransferase [Bacteroidia bacterium]|nr:glycerol acyltransferase [Bacteroidia bacterium]
MSKASVHAIPESEKFIDIEKAIGDKNPRLLKLLPKFLIKYIKRTIHQNELNNAIWRNKTRFGNDFVDAAMEEFGVKTKVIGAENIPAHGGVIMTANHPLGGLDGIAFMDVAGEYRKDIKFFVNDLLMALKNFTPIFIPVNKHGRNSPEYVHKFEEIYASSDCLLLFPAGLVSRKQSGKGIQDLVWKKSFITKAIQYKKNVVPVFIDGQNSKFFYNLAYWRKKIGIQANLEMFYLVDEMYKQKGKTLTFTFGEAISWETFTKDHPAEYWSEKVKQHTYALQTKDKSKMLPTIKNNTVSK